MEKYMPATDVELQLTDTFGTWKDKFNQAIGDINTAIDGLPNYNTLAPTNHASTATTYGVGNANNYGHLKLSDATNSTAGVSSGVAATPAAVKAAKDAASNAQTTADNAQSSADAAMTKASTLATSSAAGIVKPGTGMTVDAAGALNVSLNNTVTSTSTTQVATANAVKTAYDKAVEAQTGCLPLTGGVMTGDIVVFCNGELGVLSSSKLNSEYRYVILSAFGTNAGNFLAFRQDSPNLGGAFICRAMDANGNLYDLVGRNDGTLTWRDSPVLLPPGAVFAFAGNWTPWGCLLCNGAAVSRTTYAALFASISTTYGAGDGSTTFNLPNLANRFIHGNATAGIYVEAGLPNITGQLGHGWSNGTFTEGGAFRRHSTGGGSSAADAGNGITTYWTYDASLSNSIYGSSPTVQPPALTMRYCIKY